MVEEKSKSETPPVSPPPTLSADNSSKAKVPTCQWFMGDKSFCDKIKKGVKCEGNTHKCPF